MNADGSGRQRLTNNVHFENYPAWSPEGARIAFIAHNDYRLIFIEEWDGYGWPRSEHYDAYNSEIFIRSADGRDETVVPNTKGVGLYPPVWSPDGRRLAFTAHVGQRARYNESMPLERVLHTVQVNGSELRRIGQATTLPTWSPDGERLAFGLDDEVYTVRYDGTDRRRIVDDLWTNQVSWSPDGAGLLLASDGGVYVVQADGSDLRALGPSNLRMTNAAWSPDGSKIAARHQFDERRWEASVYVMTRDGTDVRFLAEGFLAGEEFRVRPGLCSAGVVVPGPKRNPGLVDDCAALLAVWNALVPTEMWDWDPHTPIAEWPGVTVYGHPSRVRNLVLENRGLTGPIPADIVMLTELEVLDLSGNDLSDRIPQELSKLAMLRKLNLSHNRLIGRIPQNLGTLTMLNELDLANNRLNGPIPVGLGRLSMLKALRLSVNNLSGVVPPELGNLTMLERLDLSDNDLSGCVPVKLPEMWVEASGLEQCKP